MARVLPGDKLRGGFGRAKGIMWLIPDPLRSGFAQASECLKKPCDWCSLEAVARPCVNGKPTLRPRSWPGWRNRPWSLRLFGAAISETSTQEAFVAWWTSSLRASRASRTATPENGKETLIVGVGAMATDQSPTSCELFPSVAPPWSCSKTSQLGFAELSNTFDLSATNYAEWVTRSLSRSLSLRRTLALRTSESGFSSSRIKWNTPDAHCFGDAPNCNQKDKQGTLTAQANQWPTPRTITGGAESSERKQELGRMESGGGDLQSAVETWPTPCKSDDGTRGSMAKDNPKAGRALWEEAKNWPSPRSEDSESCGNHPGAKDSLTGATSLWPTPVDISKGGSTGRGGNRKDEQLLSGMSAKWVSARPTPKAAIQGSRPNKKGGKILEEESQKFSLQDHQAEAGQESSPNHPTLRRRLNPAFAAWLMGFPFWWTRPEPINFAASATESFPSVRRWRSESSSLVQRLFDTLPPGA